MVGLMFNDNGRGYQEVVTRLVARTHGSYNLFLAN